MILTVFIWYWLVTQNTIDTKANWRQKNQRKRVKEKKNRSGNQDQKPKRNGIRIRIHTEETTQKKTHEWTLNERTNQQKHMNDWTVRALHWWTYRTKRKNKITKRKLRIGSI